MAMARKIEKDQVTIFHTSNQYFERFEKSPTVSIGDRTNIKADLRQGFAEVIGIVDWLALDVGYMSVIIIPNHECNLSFWLRISAHTRHYYWIRSDLRSKFWSTHSLRFWLKDGVNSILN